jgi:hypothetical protein
VIPIKKTILSSSDTNLILDIWKESESYSEQEVKNMIMEQFDCDSIKEERLDNGQCPYCGNHTELELDGKETYEYQGFPASKDTYKAVCNTCGWSK